MAEARKKKAYDIDYGWAAELNSDVEMDEAKEPVPGWVGGFAEKHDQWKYSEDWKPSDNYPYFGKPRPNVATDSEAEYLPMLDNMDNIDKIERCMGIRWPEFSWITAPDIEDEEEREKTRCFQKFAPYISRIGYTNEGRIYSIICPQQGVYIAALGITLNVEVTVSGQRGWVNEDFPKGNILAADMSVHATIWFSPSADASHFVKVMCKMLESSGKKFPFSKKDAIIVPTHKPNSKDAVFPLRKGETELFKSPEFAQHYDEAWAVSNIEVAFGKVKRTGHALVDDFVDLIVALFNLNAGNMIFENNTLTWNIWMTPPILADQEEWKRHAEFWRHSIDVDHGRSPTGQRTQPRLFDGSELKPLESAAEEEAALIEKFIDDHVTAAIAKCFGCC